MDMQKRNFIKRVGVFLLLNILWCGSFCSHVLAQDVDNMMVTVMMKQGTLKSFFERFQSRQVFSLFMKQTYWSRQTV